MQEHFGAAAGFVRRENAALGDLSTIRPKVEDVPYSLLGTAVDFRIRFHFQGAINQLQVAQEGAMLLVGGGGPIGLEYLYLDSPHHVPGSNPTLEASSVSEFFRALTEFVARLPYGQPLPRHDEETLCRFCVVLAYFDQAFRAGPKRLADSPLMRNHCPAVEDLLSIARHEWVEDLAAQSRLFCERVGGWVTQPHWLNPTFGGSSDVGGADADLIVGSTLIDIKATVNPKIGRPWLWQLLGYALLDYSDHYGIDTVGVYLSRQGCLLEWPIEALANEISSRGEVSWNAVRRDFRQMTSTMLA